MGWDCLTGTAERGVSGPLVSLLPTFQTLEQYHCSLPCSFVFENNRVSGADPRITRGENEGFVIDAGCDGALRQMVIGLLTKVQYNKGVSCVW